MKGSNPQGGNKSCTKAVPFPGIGMYKDSILAVWDSYVGVKSSDGFCLLRGLHVKWG